MKENGMGQRLRNVFLRKRTFLLLLIPLGILLMELCRRSAFFAEHLFARGLFRAVSVGLSFLTGWLPFSLAEITVILLPFLLLAVVAGFLVRLVREKKRRFELWMTAVLNLACTAAVVFFGYVFGCGANYYRAPVSEILELEVHDSSEEELVGLLRRLAREASELREELNTEDERGVYVLPVTTGELGKLARQAYRNLSKESAAFGGRYPAPKHVLLSHLMSYTEITGIYTCWTMEANVNIDISPYSIASTMCHELAHLRGFIKEDEANYIAYLACMASDSADVRYSGTMMALIHTGNALYRADAEAYYEVLAECYSVAVRRDLAANNEYWAQFAHTRVAEATEKVNDTYLKINHQSAGTQSYGKVVDLLLAQYRKERDGETK